MNPIPSPVADETFVYLMSGFRGNNLKAIRLAGAKGDITGTDAVIWTLDCDTPTCRRRSCTTASSIS